MYTWIAQPSREILIVCVVWLDLCCLCKMHTGRGFSAQPSLMTLTFKSKSDKGRKGNRLYISFTHTHAHTLIKKQVSPYVHK